MEREIAQLEKEILESSNLYQEKLVRLEQTKNLPAQSNRLRNELGLLSANIQEMSQKLIEQKKIQQQILLIRSNP